MQSILTLLNILVLTANVLLMHRLLGTPTALDRKLGRPSLWTRLWHGSSQFKPIRHKPMEGPKVPFRTEVEPGVRVSYFVPRDSLDSAPLMVRHHVEQDTYTFSERSGISVPGDQFREEFAEADVAQVLSVTLARAKNLMTTDSGMSPAKAPHVMMSPEQAAEDEAKMAALAEEYELAPAAPLAEGKPHDEKKEQS